MLSKEELAKFKKIPFVIHENKTGAAVSLATASVETEIFRYQVPTGMHIILPKGYDFFFDLYDGSTTPVAVTSGTFLLRKEDAAGTRMEEIESGTIGRFGGNVYEKNQRPVFKSDQLIMQSMIIRLLVNSATAIEGSNSDFELSAIALVPKEI